MTVFFAMYSIFVLLYPKYYGLEKAFYTLRHFLPNTPSRHLAQPAFIKASLAAGSSSFKVPGPPTEV